MQTTVLWLITVFTLISVILGQAAGLTVTIVTNNGQATMVSNGVVNQDFTRIANTFDCSLTYLYTYTQNDKQYALNVPYYLVFQGLTAPTSINITTVHNNFQPTYNTSLCMPPSC